MNKPFSTTRPFIYSASATLALALVSLATPAQAAQEIFMRIDSILGECNETYHKNWIVLDEVDMGMLVNDDGLRPKKFTFTKHLDRSSPKFLEAITMGRRFSQAIIHVTDSNATGQINSIVAEIILTGVKVIDVSHTFNGTSIDQVEIQYETLEFRYMYLDPHSQTGQGRVVTKWQKPPQ